MKSAEVGCGQFAAAAAAGISHSYWLGGSKLPWKRGPPKRAKYYNMLSSIAKSYRGYIEEGRTSEGKPRLIYLGSSPSSMYLRNIQETWLICDPKEAKTIQYTLWGREAAPKGILLSLASFGSQINQVSCIFRRYIEEGELPR